MLRSSLAHFVTTLTRTAPAVAFRRFHASPAPSMSVFRSDRLHNKTVLCAAPDGDAAPYLD